MFCYSFSYSFHISPTRHHPDMTIVSSSAKIGKLAHRAVLASHSYFIKSMLLSSDSEGDAVLILPDFKDEDVDQMLL